MSMLLVTAFYSYSYQKKDIVLHFSPYRDPWVQPRVHIPNGESCWNSLMNEWELWCFSAQAISFCLSSPSLSDTFLSTSTMLWILLERQIDRQIDILLWLLLLFCSLLWLSCCLFFSSWSLFNLLFATVKGGIYLLFFCFFFSFFKILWNQKPIPEEPVSNVEKKTIIS